MFVNLYYKKNYFIIQLFFLPPFTVFKILKNVLFYQQIQITDITIIEHLPKFKYIKNFFFITLFNFFFKNYFFYIFTKSYQTSLYGFFKSVKWLERELTEFYLIKINNLPDCRNLLLDYNKVMGPLLKSYPVTGFDELQFNSSTHQINYVSSCGIEL